MKRLALIVTMTVLAAACGSSDAHEGPPPQPSAPEAPQAPVPDDLPHLDQQAILQHIKRLASDEFEGRRPGTRGEDLTVQYLQDELKKLGLQPGNPDGTYVQKVPLVGITGKEARPLTVAKGTQKQTFKWHDEVVAWSKRVTDKVAVEGSEIVFAGYGVSAPEFNWNDFKDVDVKGKTILVLVNDPQIPEAGDPSTLDAKIFGGKAMTYYGRWTYKYEEGARRGAAAVIIVHETGPAGYPFAVVQGNLGEKFDLVTPDKNMNRSAVEGWVTLDAAKRMLKMAGHDFDTLKKQATSRDFQPVPLGLTASIAVQNTMRTIDSKNVVAKLEGSDARLKSEYVIYSSHWDHYGVGEPVNNDRIYNGALDNASGVAAVLDMARAFKAASPQPKRSILFLFVTAEEQGLLGSEYYALSPLYPLEKTVAVINVDGVNQWGRTKDITVVGLGASDLDDYIRDAAKARGRTITPDPEPEKGFYYRSDHFPFAKQGVPALDPDAGVDYIGKPPDFGKKKRDEYTTNDYHKPSDEVKPDWDLSGAVEDAHLLMTVGYRVANADKWPEWKPGNEFKAKRDAMLKK